jgi:hypothetical protein
VKLSAEDIEGLTADPSKYEIAMPTLAELDYALTLLQKEYRIDVFFIRRNLKWIVKKMNKHYNVEWTVPKWGTKKI